ncbi:MAG: hypothetical protein PHR16_00470 [Methylovulum sp.]|nr:hypothetical protein [Methylovulum sp.]
MKSISTMIVLLAAMVAVGCDKEENPTKPPQPTVFKKQQEALEKAKQVEGVIQDADDKKRALIDEQSE